MFKLKNNKLIIAISMSIIWIPVVIEFLFWNQLPAKIATHYNSQMVAGGYSSKLGAILVLPIIITLIQLLTVFVVSHDPKNQDIQKWIRNVIYLLIPTILMLISFFTLSTALGANLFKFKVLLMMFFTGAMLIVVGLVLKHVRPNQTVGIRLPWTLDSVENWNLTHQLGAKVFIAGGIVIMVLGILSLDVLLIPVVLLVVIIPCIYSFVLHLRGI